MARNLSRRVAESPGCIPLKAAYGEALVQRWSRWTQVETAFLEAMWKFDSNFAAGKANQGDNQNGKGDFFTDLACLLLENCSRRALESRPSVPGRIFRNHALDAAFPAEGAVEILVETKVAGTPKTARNPSQRNELGRPGSADLDKRIKEAGLKTIDLKAEWARLEGLGGGPTSDFITWLRRSKPACYLLLAIRVIDDADFDRANRMADAANQVMDACGLFCYQPGVDRYHSVAVPTHLELDRVMSRICDAMRAAPA